MLNKRPAVIKLREQELKDIKGWCSVLKSAHRCGLAQGRCLGALILLLFFIGFVIASIVNIFIIPREWSWVTAIVMLLFGGFVAWLEGHLAKRYIKENEQRVDSLEQGMIEQFDKQMVIKKGDKK